MCAHSSRIFPFLINSCVFYVLIIVTLKEHPNDPIPKPKICRLCKLESSTVDTFSHTSCNNTACARACALL